MGWFHKKENNSPSQSPSSTPGYQTSSTTGYQTSSTPGYQNSSDVEDAVQYRVPSSTSGPSNTPSTRSRRRYGYDGSAENYDRSTSATPTFSPMSCQYRSDSCCSCHNASRRPSHQLKPKTKIFHTTYACFDPNCKAGTYCKEWSISGGDNRTRRSLNNGSRQIPIMGQMPLTPGAPPIILRQQPTDKSFMGNPYLINRRQIPMTVGGVPIVIPNASTGAHIVGTVPTYPFHPEMTHVYPTINSRPLNIS